MPRSDSLEERLRFLQRPDVWPDAPHVVRSVETHLSWVFLTREYAFKLKKPIRHMGRDLRSVRARLQSARSEVELNRRLAADVYLGYLPVVRRGSGELAISGSGEPVDWLVWMWRLDEEDLLDHAVRDGAVSDERLLPAATKLAQFYARAAPEGMGAPAYGARLRATVRQNRRALRGANSAVPAARVAALHDAQEDWLAAEAELVARRAGRVLEGHGDLRPEHVYLGSPPAFIDCLEFDRALRLVDPVDELSFLGIACRAEGAPRVGEVFLATYAAITGDAPPARLVAFYEILGACTRARLAALRSLEPGEDAPKARRTARTWLERAEASVPRLGLVRG